ncbi:MAG TPA: efflux RND transporter periplasmic adaptor subunit [Planctomycetota bacterium]
MAVLLAATPGCSKKEGAPAGIGLARKPRVNVAPVARGPVSYEIETVGSFEAEEEVSVAAGVPGIVTKVLFKEGDQVTPETVLCTIDEERYALEEARAKAEQARAAADLDTARGAYDRRIPLHKMGGLTDDQMGEFKAAFDRAAAELERAEAELALAVKSRRDSSVRPPRAGVINSKNVATGEYAAAGRLIAKLLDVSALYVRFAVPESESLRVKKGVKISLTARITGRNALAAEVYWVSQVADPRSRSVECKARVLEPPAPLKPGFSGLVRIVLEERAAALLVPSTAVLPTERGFVAYVVEEGKAKERKLRLGVRTLDDQVEILDGLAEGESLVTRGGSVLQDGREVEIVK